jgi:UTP-glucose-1-phosphate uridylyltransferase
MQQLEKRILADVFNLNMDLWYSLISQHKQHLEKNIYKIWGWYVWSYIQQLEIRVVELA